MRKSYGRDIYIRCGGRRRKNVKRPLAAVQKENRITIRAWRAHRATGKWMKGCDNGFWHRWRSKANETVEKKKRNKRRHQQRERETTEGWTRKKNGLQIAKSPKSSHRALAPCVWVHMEEFKYCVSIPALKADREKETWKWKKRNKRNEKEKKNNNNKRRREQMNRNEETLDYKIAAAPEIRSKWIRPWCAQHTHR